MNAPFAARSWGEERDDMDDLLVAPSRERRRLQCYLVLLLNDIASIFIAFAFAGACVHGSAGSAGLLIDAQLVLPLYLTTALYNGAYSKRTLQDGWNGILRALSAIAISVVLLVFVRSLIRPYGEVSRASFIGGVLCAMVAITVSRRQLRKFVVWRCAGSVTNELVIEDGGPQLNLRGAITVSASAMDLRPNPADPHALERLGLVLRNIDRVIVSCPVERRADWALMLKGASVDGEVLDDEVVRLGAQGARVVGSHGLLLVSAGPLGLRDRAIKRVFDLTFAGSAIFLLLPLLILVALAVKLQDRGPVFFVQRRMGRGNRFFDMYKFRSMTPALCDADGDVSASRRDRRVTRLGGFLRATSLDELPQLFNVLLGDMSLVGPRPHATGSLAGGKLFWEVDLRYWQRHSLKPGLSGLAQVRGFRGATDHEADLVNRLQSDLEYLEGWTIVRDVKIILLTLRVLAHDRAF